MLIEFKSLLEKYKLDVKGVLHIGAHLAEECGSYYENGVQKTIWIEANPYFINHIKVNISKYNNTLVFNECISDVDDVEVTFNLSNNNGMSSSLLQLEHHKIAHPEVVFVHEIKTKTKRIDTLFLENNLRIEDYNFVTMDIQGAEGLALKGFGDMLNNVDYLFLEVNEKELYKGCMLLPEMCEYLIHFGFNLLEKQMWGDAGWGDAFFAKKI